DVAARLDVLGGAGEGDELAFRESHRLPRGWGWRAHHAVPLPLPPQQATTANDQQAIVIEGSGRVSAGRNRSRACSFPAKRTAAKPRAYQPSGRVLSVTYWPLRSVPSVSILRAFSGSVRPNRM